MNHLSDSVSIVDVDRRRRRASCARCSSATSRATSSSPAPAATAPSSRRRTAARTRARMPTIETVCRPRASAAPTSGCSTPRTSARRSAARRSPSSTLFGDTPRALAVTRRRTVYAAVFHSGNRTTTLNEGVVCNGGSGAGPCNVGGTTIPAACPAPNTQLPGARPRTRGRADRQVRPAQPLAGRARPQLEHAVRSPCPTTTCSRSTPTNPPPGADRRLRTGVGTMLFNMAVNPVSAGRSTSSTPRRGTRCASRDRAPSRGFEPLASRRPCAATYRESHHRPRRRAVLPRHLNKHIDYSTCCAPGRTPRTTRASRSRSAWRCRATARRSTSPRSARARSASSTRPARGRHLRAGRRRPASR